MDAEYAVELQLSLRAKGRQLEMADALIAAIAIRYDLILLTQDGDFRPITQLNRKTGCSGVSRDGSVLATAPKRRANAR